MRKIAAIALASLFVASPAFAEKTRVAVTQVKGSIAFMLESSLRSALRKRNEIELVSAQDWSEAKGRVGDGYADIAADLGVAATIDAETGKQGANWVATIRLRSATSGEVVKSFSAKGKEIRKLTAAVEKKLWKELGAAMLREKAPASKGGTRPPPKPAAVSASDDEEEEDEPTKTTAVALPAAPSSSSSAEPASTSRASASSPESAATATVEREPSRGTRAINEAPLEIIAGADFFARSFRYNDDLFGRLRPYTLSGAPAVDASVIWYPLAHFSRGFTTNLGVDLRVLYAIGVESSDSTGTTYPTSSLSFEGSARLRLPVGASHQVAFLAGFGTHSFAVDKGSTGTDPDVPGVSYTFLRAGAEARFSLVEDFSIRLGLGWRPILSAGAIQTDAWFPRAGAGGIDGSFAIGYRFVEALEVLVGLSGRHYFYSMNPEPGDDRVAGGAVDQYFAGTVAVSWSLR